VLIDASRPDDREVAERVVNALDKLGLVATISRDTAPELARRVAAGDVRSVRRPARRGGGHPGALFAAAYAAGGERAVADKLGGGGTPRPVRVRAAFAKRLPMMPLVARGVRLHIKADLRGAWFDTGARLGVAELFRWDH
jgi:hypothetical protein